MPKPAGRVIGAGGGGGVIGQPFVPFCFGRFAPYLVSSLFSVSTYCLLVDLDLDMPHAFRDDSHDDEADYPFDDLYAIGDEDEHVQDGDITTLEQVIAAFAARQSGSAQPASCRVVLGTDLAVRAAAVAVAAVDVVVPATDVIMAVLAVDVTVNGARGAKPAAPTAQGA